MPSLVWIRPAIAAFLVSFAFLMRAYKNLFAYSQTSVLTALFAQRLLSPRIDAGLIVRIAISLASLGAGWAVLGRHEKFRF